MIDRLQARLSPEHAAYLHHLLTAILTAAQRDAALLLSLRVNVALARLALNRLESA